MVDPPIVIEAAGREVTITNPEKVFFPKAGYTKLDLVRYYLAVADGALRGVMNRPMVLKRFVNGVEEEPFFQKRAPANLPPGIETARVTFPSGRSADLCVIDDAADLAWVINLGCVDLNPWAVRANDVDHPDELRIDLDPTPGADFAMVRELALVCRDVLADYGYRGFPKTSGSRGIHINVRIEPRWTFTEVRQCALAFGRECERRVPGLATTKWWKEERHGVFIDYNQNARDHTMAAAYSVRGRPDARVSTPIRWEEIAEVEPGELTVRTVPARFAALGDLHATIDEHVFAIEPLLEWAARDERDGLDDPPADAQPRRR